MRRIHIITLQNFRRLPVLFALGSIVILAAALSPTATAQNEWAVQRAQEAVRNKIWQEQGGANNIDVTFPDWYQAETYSISNDQLGVRGRGTYARRNNYTSQQQFAYNVVLNFRNRRADTVEYFLDNGPGNGGVGGPDYGRPEIGMPDWLFGAYRGKNPASKEKLSLFISRNGSVRASYDNGGNDRGRYENGFIRFGRTLSWEVSQSGNDLRIRDPRTGRREILKRTSSNGESGGNWNPGGSGGGNWNPDRPDRVPDWAVGTFRGNTSAGESELIILPDGTVTARSLNNNTTAQGSLSRGVLTFSWGSFDVFQDGNGIVTRNRADPNNQTRYVRARQPR